MYQFHSARTQGTHGFVRPMFYSIIQQLFRQDPLWYAFQVACRPDHWHQLITYLYVAKGAQSGQNTGFLHIDLNIDEYDKNRQGVDRLTSSLSLSHENERNCTVVVPGFHKFIDSWLERMKQRRQKADNHGASTIDGSKRYLPEDERDFGKAIPTPCPRFGLRFSLATIMHGSTPHADQDRYVIYAWHTRINPNDQLELFGQHSYSELRTCHLDMEAPTKGVSGDDVKKDRPPYPFPGNIHMKSSTALGDALIGRRTYDDWHVLKELCILFGSDDQKAKSYVKNGRRKLIENAIEAWRELPEMEMEAFGENSFFRTVRFLSESMQID
jgi:hypothetical protein